MAFPVHCRMWIRTLQGSKLSRRDSDDQRCPLLLELSELEVALIFRTKFCWTAGKVTSATGCPWHPVQAISAFSRWSCIVVRLIGPDSQRRLGVPRCNIIIPVQSPACTHEGTRSGCIPGILHKQRLPWTGCSPSRCHVPQIEPIFKS